MDRLDPRRYRMECLPNGLVRVFDYQTRMSGLYRPNGDWHSGGVHWAGPLVLQFVVLGV